MKNCGKIWEKLEENRDDGQEATAPQEGRKVAAARGWE